MILRSFTWVLLFITLSSCAQKKTNKYYKQVTAEAEPIEVPRSEDGLKTAYFASGCFWCSEPIFNSVFGVVKVVSGYAGGTGEDPTYRDYVKKGHTETVAVVYNPDVVNFETLLQVYFTSQNVTQQNGQGPDSGPGYRSVIFYQNEGQKQAIRQKIKEVQVHYSDPVAAQVIPFQKFWKAEEYHQDFDKKNPNHPYVQKVSLPRLYRFQNRNPELLKQDIRDLVEQNN